MSECIADTQKKLLFQSCVLVAVQEFVSRLDQISLSFQCGECIMDQATKKKPIKKIIPKSKAKKKK